MSEEDIKAARHTLRGNVTDKFSHHRMFALVTVVIVIAIGMATAGVVLYNVSGTAQLDLSRPGFEGVATRIDEDLEDFETFSADGEINSDILEEFREMMEEQVDNARAYDAFGGDPLNPDAIGVGDPAEDSDD